MATSIERGIQQRGDSFLVDVTVGGVRRRETVGSLEEARTVRDRLKANLPAQLVNELNEADRSWTLGEAFDKLHGLVWKGTLAESSSVRNAKIALEFFGAETLLDTLSSDWMDSYVARMKELGLSNATINRRLAAVSKIITFAFKRGKVKARPHFERQSEYAGRIRFLSYEEEKYMIAYLTQWGQTEHLDAFCVLIDTGLRPSELWRLQGRDVDFAKGVLSIWQTKNKQPRSVPMTQRVRAIIQRRKDQYGTGRLFAMLDNFKFIRMWDRAKQVMGLNADKQFIPYALRHTCASRLVQKGVHLRVVQEWMGHKTISVTMRYAHLSPANLLEAVKVLEAV